MIVLINVTNCHDDVFSVARGMVLNTSLRRGQVKTIDLNYDIILQIDFLEGHFFYKNSSQHSFTKRLSVHQSTTGTHQKAHCQINEVHGRSEIK